MSNILDAMDATLNAQMDVKAWRQDFLLDWFEPMTDMALVMFWAQLTPTQHAMMKAISPDAYKETAAKVKQITGGK